MCANPTPDVERSGAIMRCFNDIEPRWIAAPIMSGYILRGAAEVFEQLNLPDTHYIMCAMYAMVELRENCTGDTQLFVTGTTSAGETPVDACFRELHEELWLRPGRLSHCATYHPTSKHGRVVDWFSCEMTSTNATIAAPVEVSAPVAKCPLPVVTENRMPINNKISCIIHGTYDQMLGLLARMTPVEQTSDNIVGVVCIRAKDVRKMLRTRPTTYSRLDRFFWCGNADVYAFAGKHLPAGSAAPLVEFARTRSPAALRTLRRIFRKSPAPKLNTKQASIIEPSKNGDKKPKRRSSTKRIPGASSANGRRK